MSVVKTVVWSLAGVLAVNLSGLGVNLAFGHDVTLDIDGQSQVVNVGYGSVAEVLNAHDITLTSRDRVEPRLRDIVTDGMTITVEYARPVDLTLNGDRGTYWTYATTVNSVLATLGLTDATSLKLSVPTDTAVPRDGLALTVLQGHMVNITADGATRSTLAFGTVNDALTTAGLTWTSADIVTPEPGAVLSDQMAISIVRVTEQTVTRDSPIPFSVENSDDPDATKGKVTVLTAGVNGVLTETFLQTLHDGVVATEVKTGEQVTAAPVTEVRKTGTKVVVAPVKPAATAPAGTDAATAQAIARDMVHARGWDDSQFSCLVNLWNRESGWRWNAGNKSSGAYGIPQALPGSKMASAGADWRTNPATQITWGLGYITGRYGTPCGAWSSFQAKGWY